MSGVAEKPIRILMVCLGNICRSPTAEGVLREMAAREAPRLAIEIDSAGTVGYHTGSPPDRRTQRAALARGIDLGALRARMVRAEDFRHFDLILAMDRSNLRWLESSAPADCRAKLRLLLSYAPETGRMEVPDPYEGDAAAFEEVLDLTTAASRGVLAALGRETVR